MTKRTSDQFMAMDDDEPEYELEDVPMTESCDVVRRKIRAFIDNGEMKVGEFQKAINVTSNSSSRFMGQNGPHKGSGSDVYMLAWAFFKKRELRGIQTTANKKAKTVEPGSKDAVPSVQEIVLEGEMDDSVLVFDTCDEIRRKISAHLKKPGVTQAAFLRDVAAQYHTEPKKIQSSQLSKFRSKKGPYAGNTGVIFYGAYVYFEKLRIKEKKPKGIKRLEMEDVWASQGGMDTERRRGDRVWCAPGLQPHIDSLGLVHFSAKP
ncbi:hypothetical protein EK21DRAFT_88734 [Setomelanomma holmii]|uniref:DUF7726 domain-containing protein n=1 Tax=Setomelanomma holmii TaxID=210430 RepID=A0A9P4HAQ2_9PLEO|nr:hypothetical protein EK21DRAFT_88734 [Setomelanomma holmii]